jgi:metal-responsive CopG/Arc/MetJ family transcriptional regulator
MISIPDQLLERIDDHARSTHETRSGFLRRIAAREIETADADRRQEVERLLGAPMPLGGEAARLIREDRDSR